MIAVDTNLLIYAHREDADFHEQAIAALQGLAESDVRWSIPWPCLHEFLAITTHSRIFNPPTPAALALEAMDVWLASPGCEMLALGPGYHGELINSSQRGRSRGRKFMTHASPRCAFITASVHSGRLTVISRDLPRSRLTILW